MKDTTLLSKKWMWYCNQEKMDEYDLSLNNLLSFLDFQAFDVKSSVKQVKNSAGIIHTCRRMIGDPFKDAELDIISKYVCILCSTILMPQLPHSASPFHGMLIYC